MDMKYKDISGPNGIPDGIIDNNDKTIIGNPNPEFYGGVFNTFVYKNRLFNRKFMSFLN